MKKRDKEFLKERSATCRTCGLTARNQSELDNHINHAHTDIGDPASTKRSSDQKKDPFP